MHKKKSYHIRAEIAWLDAERRVGKDGVGCEKGGLMTTVAVLQERGEILLASTLVLRHRGLAYRGIVASMRTDRGALIIRAEQCRRHVGRLRWIHAADQEIRIPLDALASIHANGRCTIQITSGAVALYPPGCPEAPNTCGALQSSAVRATH